MKAEISTPSAQSACIQESLKSTRLLHGTLVLVCASVLAVVVSPRTESDYSAAIAELNTLAGIDLSQFIEDSRQKVQSLAKEMDLATAYRNAFDTAMRHELEQAGLALPNPTLDHEIFLPVFDEDYVRGVSHGGKVEKYRDLISENTGVEYIFVEPTYLAAAFVSKIRDMNFPPGARITGMKLVMRPPLYASHAPKTFHLSMALILAVLKPTIGSYLAVVEDPPVSSVSTFDGTRIQDWLRKKQFLDRLVDNRGGDQRSYTAEFILPWLRSVWSLVADKAPEEAKRVLLAEVERSRRRVSLLGVEIDTQMVIFAGPLLVAVLFTSLLSHVRHLQRICQADANLLCTFPWLPLFPDVLSRLLSLLTIILLPIVALSLLLFRLRHIGVVALCIAIPLSVTSVALACACLHQIRTLRKRQIQKR